MKTLAPLLILALAAGCRNFETPTEPLRVPASAAVGDSRFALDPPAPVLKPGETITIAVRSVWPYPLGVDFGCVREECEVARIRGSIPQGGDRGTITVTALKPGNARIVATLWNFGRAPGSATVGEVAVVFPEARRRAVRH